jgi:hypothetical protein
VNTQSQAGQAAIEVNLHNKETAEMLRDMLVEQCGNAIKTTCIARCDDGWILHIWLTDANDAFDIVGRVYLVLSVNGAIVARRESVAAKVV